MSSLSQSIVAIENLIANPHHPGDRKTYRDINEEFKAKEEAN